MKRWREGMRDDIGFIVKHPEADKEGGETAKMTEIKPCPFCGETPSVCGRKRRDYVNGIWAEQGGEEYWVKPNCLPMCFLGNIHAAAFGIVDGVKYSTPEIAIKAWNKRKGEPE